MSITIKQTKNSFLKKVALLGSLFLAIFIGVFYLVNLSFDKEEQQTTAPSVTSSAEAVDLGAELKKRMGSTAFSIESYEEWAKRYGLAKSDASTLDADPDEDGLPNYLEYVHGTNPLSADSDKDNYSDKQEIINGYDPDAPGDTKPGARVVISKLNINAPLIWSLKDDEKSMLSDLERGVSHYPKTATPGQNGNMVISGHSSNYIWAKGNYNHIFENLNNLEAGDIITIKTEQENGRNITYKYKVIDKFIASSNDERIFTETPNPTLTLSTCWPLGTNFKRAVIKAELVK